MLKSPRALFALFPLLLPAAGCHQLVMAPWVLWGEEPTRTVKAEYPYLQDKKVTVAVWAEMDTTFEFPFVQTEVGSFVEDALRTSVKGVTVTPTRQVVEYQNRNGDWDRAAPEAIGKHFGAQRLIVVELTQYSTREPDNTHLMRARVAANVKVYDTSYPNSEPVYKTEVRAEYPPDGPGAWGVSEATLRGEAMRVFAQELAGRFYDRKVKA